MDKHQQYPFDTCSNESCEDPDQSEKLIWKCSPTTPTMMLSSRSSSSTPASNKTEAAISPVPSSPGIPELIAIGERTQECDYRIQSCQDTEEDTCACSSSPSSSPTSTISPLQTSAVLVPSIHSTCSPPTPPTGTPNSRPPKPQQNPPLGHYWLFMNETSEWLPIPRWSESEIKLPPTAPPPEPLPSTQTPASRTEASKKKSDDGIENIVDNAKREYNIVAGRKVKQRVHKRKRKKALWDIAIKGVPTSLREPPTGTNSDFFPISNWRYGQRVALIHDMHYYILPNITDWTVPTPDKDIENAVETGRGWVKSEHPNPQVKITAPDGEMSVIRDLKKHNAALVALDPPGEQTAGTIVVKGPQNDEKSTITEEARPRKKRKGKPMVAEADDNEEEVILKIPPNLHDLRSGFPDKTIAILMAVLIQLARDGNMNAGNAVAAFNGLLDDGVSCLPTRNELQKFYLHECKLMDLISAVTTEVKPSGTPIESDKFVETNGSDSGGGIILDKEIPIVQQPAPSPQSPDIPQQVDSEVKKPWRYRDDQGYIPPPARPAMSPILPQQEQQEIDPPLNSTTSVINSLEPPISTKTPSQVGKHVATNVSPCKVYTFILTGTEMQKMSSKLINKLAQRWLLEANERITVTTPNSEIRLQDLRVDGKSPMERIITVTSNLDSVGTKEQILRALRGWNSIEAVFQETDYPQWVIKGAPLGDPRQIAESVARVTRTSLGPRRPVFLARGANTGILRFSTVAGDNPMATHTVELDGKLLSIDHYDKDHRGKREADKLLPLTSIGLRKRKRKHFTAKASDRPE